MNTFIYTQKMFKKKKLYQLNNNKSVRLWIFVEEVVVVSFIQGWNFEECTGYGAPPLFYFVP